MKGVTPYRSPAWAARNWLIVIGFLCFVIILLFLRATPRTQTFDYDYQENYRKYNALSTVYEMVIVSDLDKLSKQDDHWMSVIQHLTLIRDHTGKYSFKLQKKNTVTSTFNEAGRAMELSDVCNFNNKLYTFDDRTGLLMVIDDDLIYPVNIMMDGNGRSGKGFKGEWCTVKDDKLYVGGMGKEWTDSKGNFVNNNPLWVKVIDSTGSVTHVDWEQQYAELKETAGIKPPGYILNEAVIWIPSKQAWHFFPRRVSHKVYDAEKDEYRCANIGFSSSPITGATTLIENVGELVSTRGFSSAKFIPYRENEVVFLKTDEVDGVRTYIMVYDLSTGTVLLPDTLIDDKTKFEGIEFV